MDVSLTMTAAAITPVQIIEGDSLKVLSQLEAGTADLIVADPPYSSGGLHQSSRNIASGKKYTKKEYPDFHGDNMDGPAWYRWAYEWLSDSYRVLRTGGYMFVFTDWRQLANASAALQAAGFIWRGLVVWDKGGSARLPHTGYLRHQAEYIVWGEKAEDMAAIAQEDGAQFAVWGTKGACSAVGHARASYDGVIRCPVESNKEHPTQKPPALYRHLFDVVPPGSLVIDPFLGSGTSALAALDQGHRFIGVEKEPYFAELARAKLQSYQEQKLKSG